jgi:hypothetical protein
VDLQHLFVDCKCCRIKAACPNHQPIQYPSSRARSFQQAVKSGRQVSLRWLRRDTEHLQDRGAVESRIERAACRCWVADRADWHHPPRGNKSICCQLHDSRGNFVAGCLPCPSKVVNSVGGPDRGPPRIGTRSPGRPEQCQSRPSGNRADLLRPAAHRARAQGAKLS